MDRPLPPFFLVSMLSFLRSAIVSAASLGHDPEGTP
ncbi:hypothetical protein Pan44_03780 [Caulifigura coniformis]|uniref:Uncharacterized protein n=1 Tax=Caulifigura coniformis TaxID=2527983 RepID=A0A517S8B7_9PLAN|nr:hypothetical protein Pan44_03780 [Caulifigura coniformis]